MLFPGNNNNSRIIMAAVVLARRSVTSSISISRKLFSNHCIIISTYYHHLHLLHLSTKTHEHPSNTNPLPVLFTEDYFISKYHFSPQIASKLASVSAHVKNPQNPDVVLSCLKERGFSNAHLERVVRHHSRVLSLCPERSVKPKFKIFHDLGLSAADVTQLIAREPNILKYEPNRIISSLSVYRGLLGSNDHVVKLIKKCGSVLYADPENTILPNIQFLKSCGVRMEQINTLIYTYTCLFLKSPENMRRCVRKADEMGVDRTSKMFIRAAWAVCTMSDENLKLKLKAFQDLGFPEDDILRLFRSYPVVISVSTRKLKEVIEVLLETGKYDMSCIIKNPTSFTLSVEKRFKPRLEVLKALERKSLIDKWPGLSQLCTMSNKKFFEKFVAPNMNEVGEEFIVKTGVSGKLEMPISLKSS